VSAAVPDQDGGSPQPPGAPPQRTPLVLVLCAWTVVVIPLSWGLYQSLVKSRPLFTGTAAPAASVR
jgi:hypothetical protein